MRPCTSCGKVFEGTTLVCPACAEWVGRVVSDRYRIQRRIGEGALGIVCQAVDTRADRLVALKILKPRLAEDARVVRRFHTEVRSVARLHHPGCIQVYEAASDGATLHYLVMEMVVGETLTSVLDDAPLPIARAVSLAAQLARAVAAGHELGIIHRDVKPENVVVSHRGPVEEAHLGDFAVVRNVLGEALTATGAGWLGTTRYMSPEQFEPGRNIDHRTDVYSLGAVLYHMLVGQPVVPPSVGLDKVSAAIRSGESARHPRARRPSVPAWLDELCARALATSPDDRFQTAEEMATALEWGLRAQPVGERPWRSWALAAALGALLPLAALVALAAARRDGAVVPSLVGLDEAAARRELGRAHLGVGEVTSAPSDAVVKGRIAATQPAPGARLRPGAGVALVVSRGPQLVEVPSFAGHTVGDARAALFELELKPGVVVGPGGPAGDDAPVLGTCPPAGASVAARSRVDLVVGGAAGATAATPAGTVELPTVRGRFLDEMRDALAAKKLVPGREIDVFAENVSDGEVIAACPVPGTRLPAKTRVDLVVSDHARR